MRQATIPEPPVRTRRVDVSAYLGPVMALAILLSVMTLVSVSDPRGVTLAHSSLLNVSITAAALVIAMGVAFFSLTEFALYGWLASLLVGMAFVLLAESSLGDGLVP